MDDKQQVKHLFEQYHRAIFAYLYRLVNNAETASDLTQETFLQILRHRQKLAAVENQRAWIYRIATNLAYSHLRRRHRFRWLPWQSNQLRQQSGPDLADQIAQRLQTARALAAVPPKYRAPLLLKNQFDFSVKEIAAILKLTEANVKVRLHRARQMFRQAFAEEELS
jgi:RNA polymerase sigma-70 factor, ECF subfamily